MKSLSKIGKVSVTEYLPAIFRFAFAAVIAFIIHAFSIGGKVSGLLTDNNYNLSLGFHILIALIIVEFIHWLTFRLDDKISWLDLPYKRLLHQMGFGILLPTAAAMLLVKAFLSTENDTQISDAFLIHYLMLIFLLIVFVNAYYIIYYISKVLKEKAAQTITVEVEETKVPAAEINKAEINKTVTKPTVTRRVKKKPEVSKNQPLVFPIKNIALIIIREDGCFIISSDNEKLVWPHSMGKTIKHLPAHKYFLINRSVIISRDNIKSLRDLDSRRVQLVLKAPENEIVYVSQRQSTDFRIWLNERKK